MFGMVSGWGEAGNKEKPWATSQHALAMDRLRLSTLEALRRNRSTSPGLTDLQMFIFVSFLMIIIVIFST